MFCPRCGTKLPDDAEFCSKCGTQLNNIQNNETQGNEHKELTTSEALLKKNKEFFDPKIKKIKEFTKKYKKQIITGLSCFVVLILLAVLYNSLFGFEKFSWNKEYKDLKLNYVTQNKVQLAINFSDENKLDKIKYKTTCGEYTQNGKEIEWDLSESLGKCEIELSYKLRKIKKDLTVISPFIENNLTLDEEEIDYDSDEDLDLDNLTNKEEKEYKTNPLLSDTDMDNLNDDYEINTSKTDPLKKDTDGDSLSDYDEIELGLDPLKTDSKGDGVQDGNRELTYNITNDKLGITVNLVGTGNIASTTINTFKNKTFKDAEGILDTVYNFYTDGKIKSAEVLIHYSLEEITAKGLDENNLVLYYFNEDTKKLEAMPTEVDKESKIIKVKLSHFSKYVLGDKTTVIVDNKTKIMVVLDNSISMYTYKQLEDKGYSVTGAEGNDSTFKRVTLTNKLIDMLTGNYHFGVAEFAGYYVNLNKFTDNKETSKNSVNSIKYDIDNVGDGTNIVNALNKGISEFSKDEDNHYLILLTDGKDTNDYTTLADSKKSIISNAKEKDIKVCVIGLGKNIDTDDLKEISTQTGCGYYNANDANALDEIYGKIAADINYNLVDTDLDGVVDSTLIADSGFLVTRDGFSFNNYGTNLSENGHCYGMATFAELYYLKKLPLKMDEKTINFKRRLNNVDEKSYSYDLTNTYFANYDNLYDYKLQTNELKYSFGYESFGEEEPKDKYSVENKTLIFDKDYLNPALETNMYDVITVESGLSEKEQIERHGANYENYERLILNEDKMQEKDSLIKNDDKQLFNAIYTSFIKQDVTQNYTSGVDFYSFARNVVGKDETTKIEPESFIDVLKSRLESGDPAVISGMFDSGFHAVNAITLTQNISNSNKYSIGVYDNNYPGEKRYIDIICNKKKCLTESNAYYSGSGRPIRISYSLEDDLAYFN